MERNKALKRLYVGGLSHTISQAELQERFSKFGNVTDVEIITRKDEQGTPVKTFGYFNINISEPELQKCMSVLNKTRWKGGTLQIELAKESFLHRLALERQEAKEKREVSHTDSKESTIESLKKVGVVDFHMKAAVPGTEVPNHKDWVVSKFGRVLPVLHLRGQRKNKIIKYDPSKYCHNIKKLEQATAPDTVIPISQLTWCLEGGDNDISRKRRGEFPDIKMQPKKKIKSLRSDENKDSQAVSTADCSTAKKELRVQVQLNQRAISKRNDTPELACCTDSVNKELSKNGSEVPTGKRRSSGRDTMSFAESDVDSEEELRVLIEQERRNIRMPSVMLEDSDHLEVVGDNFQLKYDTHWAIKNSKKDKAFTAKNNASYDENDSEYDSADTDEIISVIKTPDRRDTKTEEATTESKLKITEKASPQSLLLKSKDSAGTEKVLAPNWTTGKLLAPNRTTGKDVLSSEPITQAKAVTLKVKDCFKAESSCSSSSDSESEDHTYDYEAMMKNCYRIDLSLDDLKQLASKPVDSSGEESKASSSKSDSEEAFENSESSIKSSQSRPLPRQSITPDEVVSALLEVESSEEERKPQKKAKGASLPAFKGTKALLEVGQPEKQAYGEEEPAMPLKRKVDQVPSSTLTPKKQKKTIGKEETTSDTDSSNSEEDSSPASKPPPFKGMACLQGPYNYKVQPMAGKTLGTENTETSFDPSSSDSGSEKSASKPLLYFGTKSQTIAPEEGADESLTGPLGLMKGIKQDPVSSSYSGAGSGDREGLLSIASKIEKNVRTKKEGLKTIAAIQSTDSNSDESILVKNETCEDLKHSLKANKEPVTSRENDHSRNVDKQLLDNQKRLAAVQQKQKEAEMQKRLIQGALSKVDAASVNKRQHIVFDSEEEESVAEQEPSSKEAEMVPVVMKKMKALFSDSDEEPDSFGEEGAKSGEGKTERKISHEAKEFRNKVAGKLFESSDDETGDDEDMERFRIKPQYEGKAGQKLMQLQSRFGADERFRMDARFLDSDDEDNDDDAKQKTEEEEDLATEKKKNLEILQSLLHVSIENPESKKEATKKQKFKDVTALHYDPTREDHAVFETNVDEPKKESKAERKKMRQEAEKLPEVSKKTYYDIAVDLKEVLRSAKNKVEEKEEIAWDKQEDESKETLIMEMRNDQSSQQTFGAFPLANNVEEESSGFKFSFFGIDMVDESKEATETTYKTETLKAAKVPWQEDPRFQDSSSEEEDGSEDDQTTELATKSEESLPADKINLFFFFKDDKRLREGPKLFCRSSVLEEQRDSWEEKRSSLIEEYRKKHKDARRKVKARQ